MKWDGHTHSQFCRHGSGDKTSVMIEKAIALGFERYSIVEHAPLPDGIISDPEVRLDFGLMWDELPDYFQHLSDLKRVYGNRIKILSGLEIDFLEGLEPFAAELVSSLAGQLDDVIVSTHFIKGKDGFKPLDYRPDIFESELIGYYGSIDNVHMAYWETVERMIDVTLNLPATKRIGHLGLINKFSALFQSPSEKFNTISFYEKLLKKIKTKGWALDFNVAGLKQKWYQDVYLTAPMQFWVNKYKIQAIYGSDAHSVDAVGQFYDIFLKLSNVQ